MRIPARMRQYTDVFDQRSVAEKTLIALLFLFLLVWMFAEFVYGPRQGQLTSLSRQIASAETRLVALQRREEQAQSSSAEDPNFAVRQRIEQAIVDQARLQSEIEQLAGNLVTPQSMTRLLTSMLENQSGLQLVRVENRAPQIMRSPGASDAAAALENQQVFRHSLVLELEGDYLSLVAYLLRIEAFPERFFWDQISFVQSTWPAGRIVLELHTLSTERGFVGV